MATARILPATTFAYWYMLTTDLISFAGVRQVSPKLKTFFKRIGFYGM